MKALLKRVDHQFLGVSAILTILLGLLFSRAMMSIGMIALAVNGVVNLRASENFHRFLRNPALLGLTGIFLLYLLSGLNSENLIFWLERIRIKLPFLLLPFAVLGIPRFDKRVYYPLLYFFFWLIVVMCLYSLLRFIIDYEAIIYSYREGKVMPTPVMHIRFSLMVAYSVAIGWFLYREGYFVWQRWERPVTLAATVLLIVFLHLLAVRSGLLALYAVLAYLLVSFIIRHRRYALGVGLAVAVGLSALLAYRMVPTLFNKVNYTIYSLQLFTNNGDLSELSDSYRLGSIEAGIQLGNRHFWTGVGVGDMRDACNNYFKDRYPALAGFDLMPHNQFVFVYAGMGILGLLYFTWAVLQPLFYRHAYRHMLIVSFHLIALSSFLVEHTIETQLGTSFYLLFVLLGIRHLEDREKTNNKNLRNQW